MTRDGLGVRRSRHGGLVLIALLGLSGASLAQETASANDVALARSLGLEGVQLADAGNCAAAADKLQRAESLYHAPTILGRLGECQVAIGKLVAGTENLQKVVRETLPPRAPKPFVEAQARAQKVLNQALPKVPKLKIHVDMPPGVRPAVKLDGEPVSLAALDADRPADPGPHQLEASAPGFRTATAQTTLAEGSTGAVSVKLEPDSVAVAAPPVGGAPVGYPPPPGAQPGGPSAPYGAPAYPPQPGYGPAPAYGPGAPQPPPEAESKGSSNTLGYVLIGVGAAGVVVGSVFGGLALSKKSSLDTACGQNKSGCPSSAQGDIDSMKTSATVSTVALAAGGAGLVIGLIVLATAKPSAAGEVRVGSVAARPFVGPQSAGFSGSF